MYRCAKCGSSLIFYTQDGNYWCDNCKSLTDVVVSNDDYTQQFLEAQNREPFIQSTQGIPVPIAPPVESNYGMSAQQDHGNMYTNAYSNAGYTPHNNAENRQKTKSDENIRHRLNIYLRRKKGLKYIWNSILPQGYSFANVVEAVPVTEGLMNRIFIFKISAIKKDSSRNELFKYILRIYGTKDIKKPKFEYEKLSSLRKLVNIPIPTPYILETKSKIFENPFLIESLIPGDTVTSVINYFTPEQSEAFMVSLAQNLSILHHHRSSKFDPGFSSSKKNFVDFLYDDINNRLEYFRKANLDRIYHVDVSYFKKWFESHKPLFNIKKYSLIHGDVRPSNILVQNGKISGFIDWEFSKTSDPAWDIGWALYFFRMYENLRERRDLFFRVYWAYGEKFDIEARVNIYETLAAIIMMTYTKSVQMGNPWKFNKQKDFFERVIKSFPHYMDRVKHSD